MRRRDRLCAAICVVASATATTAALIAMSHFARVASCRRDIVDTTTPSPVENRSQ
jgi:hypothetical protein